MKKILVLSFLLCANFSFSSDADNSSNVSTPRTEPFPVFSREQFPTILPNDQFRREVKGHSNQSMIIMSLCLALSMALMSCIGSIPEDVVDGFKPDCNKPFLPFVSNSKEYSKHEYNAQICVQKAVCENTGGHPWDVAKNRTGIFLRNPNITESQRNAVEKCWPIIKIYLKYIYNKNTARQNFREKKGF